MLSFFSSQWLLVRIYFYHSRGLSGLYILGAQVFVKFFDVFFEHLILDIQGCPFFVSSDSLGFCLHFLLQCLCQLCKFSGSCHSIFLKIFPFFLLSLPLSEPVPVAAIIDNSFLQWPICLCIRIYKKKFISSIFASFARQIHCLCQLWLQRMFKLSFLSNRTWRRREVLSFSFFLFWFSRSLMFIARATCGLLNVTVAALCISSAAVTLAMSNVVGGRAVCV